jgi:hypothetical protein
VLSRAAHAVLIWRLEKGEHVGILDLLAGSTSLTSTAVSQFKLGIVSFTGFALLMIWALSPVGGQASLRQVTTGTKVDIEPTTFSYYVSNANIISYDDSMHGYYYAQANSLLVASLYSPEKSWSATTDIWSNAKISIIETYEDSAVTDSQGWVTFSASHGNHSSLLGVPMSNVDKFSTDDRTKYTVNMETSYLHFYSSALPLSANFTTIPTGASFGTDAWI